MFTWKRFILASAGTLLLALTFITLVLPGIIIDRASRWVADETGRVLEIESVSINPFSLSIVVRKLKLSDTDQSISFVTWDQLRVSLSIASLYHWAPVIDELRLDRPELRLEKFTADRFNFSDLLQKEGEATPVEPTDEPGRFSVNNLSINDGRIDLVDSSLKEQIHHTIHDLQLVLPSIGNLPYMIDNPAQPLFRAVVNDSPININGQLKPFTNIQEMQLDLVLDNIDLPFYLAYLPIDLPVELRNGKLSIDLDILYRISAETGGELELSGQVDLASLDIWDRQQEQLFFLPLLRIEIAPSRPLKQEFHLAALRAYNLEVQLNRNQHGEWNHARMASAEKKQSATAADEQKTSAPFSLTVDTIEVHDGIVFFKDSLPVGGFNSIAREINLDIKDFALVAKSPSPFSLTLKTARDEAVALTGELLLNPFTLEVQSELRNLPLGAYQPYYQEVYSKPFAGTLELEANLQVRPEQPLLISDGRVAIKNFHADFNDREGVNINRIDIAGLSYALAKNSLAIESVSSADALVNFSRDKLGAWSFMSQNFPVLAKPAANAGGATAPRKEPAVPAFSYRVGKLAIDNWDIAVRDDQPATPVKIMIDDLALTADNLAAPGKAKSPFSLSMTLQRKGRIALQGSFSLADQETAADLRLKSFPLRDLAPYLAEQTNLVLVDGSLNAQLRVSAAPAGKSPQAKVSGNLGISRMHLLDGTHREDLLKWDSLQIAGIKGSLSPTSLAIDSVTLSDYFAKVTIDEDARLNLTEAFNKTTEQTTERAVAQEEEPNSEQDAAKPDISIDKFVLQGGQVDFTDRSLPHPFHADMRDLGGLIEGLSSATASRAEVDLRGKLRNQSPLNISGTINPLAEELFLDLELSFRDIEMSPFSPYSGNFVGYLIEKGKLNLTLDYLLENKQLKASNSVFLDQFSFGEAVESAQATSLPVKLAVALLKDSKGEIHLDIPVFGRLDDPQFSISGVVWTVIKNLLVKAATSPFALLGAMLGGGEEDFSSISFEYGSARLSDTERDKLLRMAQALLDRPSLEIEVSGFIDPDNDAEGYRREQLLTQIKRLKYLDLIKELPEGTKEEEITVLADEYADYLWQAYSKTDFPKPRSFIGMTKKLPATEMEKLIYTNTVVTEDQLAMLAQARALEVQNYLVEVGQLGQERIFLKKPDISAAPEKETAHRARVELNATVR